MPVMRENFLSAAFGLFRLHPEVCEYVQDHAAGFATVSRDQLVHGIDELVLAGGIFQAFDHLIAYRFHHRISEVERFELSKCNLLAGPTGYGKVKLAMPCAKKGRCMPKRQQPPAKGGPWILTVSEKFVVVQGPCY
jgi:hypothetical protein